MSMIALWLPSPISGSKPFMWRTVGAKVKPFSESAKSIGSFFRADAQEKARRLIPPKKNPDALGGTIPLRIGQDRFCGHKSTPFFFTDKSFKFFFQPVRQKNSPRRKGLPPKKEDKRERIYNMFARVRRLHQNRILTQPLTNLKYCLRQPIYSDWKAFFVSLQSLPDSNNLDQSFAKNG